MMEKMDKDDVVRRPPNASSSAVLLAQGSMHYHDERFHDAAIAFSKNLKQEDQTCTEQQPGQTTIFGAIPRAALLADTTLCEFRSAYAKINSTTKGGGDLVNDFNNGGSAIAITIEATIDLLHKARDANKNYIQVLEKAILALRREATEERDKQYNIQKEDASNQNGYDHSSTSSLMPLYAVSKYRKQTALAALMAGVSASWLYLYQIKQPPTNTEQTSQTFMESKKRPYHSSLGNSGNSIHNDSESMSRKVLHETICLAYSCFLPHPSNTVTSMNDVTMPVSSWEEGLATIKRILSFSSSSLSRGRDEEFEKRRNERGKFALEEQGRIQHVLQTVDNALRLVNLSSSHLLQPENSNKSHKKQRLTQKICSSSSETYDKSNNEPSKQQSKNSEGIKTTTFDFEADTSKNIPSKLLIQSHVTKALRHHSQMMMMCLHDDVSTNTSTKSTQVQDTKYDGNNQLKQHHKDKRDEHLEKALMMEHTHPIGGLPGKLCLVFKGLDQMYPLDPNQKDGDHDKKYDWIISQLEKLPSKSPLQLDIIACLYSHKGDFDKALEAFQKNLEVLGTDNTQVCQERDQSVILSNIAQCLVQMGKPSPAVELYLHLLSLSETEECQKHASEIVPYCQNISKPTTTTTEQTTEKKLLLWKLFHASSLTGEKEVYENAANELRNVCTSDELDCIEPILTATLASLSSSVKAHLP